MLLFVFSLLVHAQSLAEKPLSPQKIQGDFSYTGRFSVLSHQQREVVETETAQGRKKLNRLLQSGWDCRILLPMNARNCERNLPRSKATESQLTEYLKTQWGGRVWSFYEWAGEPEIGTLTDFYRLWTVPQKVVLWDHPHESVDWLWNPVTIVWVQNQWKLYLGRQNEDNSYLFELKNGALELHRSVVFVSGAIEDQYRVLLTLEREAK